MSDTAAGMPWTCFLCGDLCITTEDDELDSRQQAAARFGTENLERVCDECSERVEAWLIRKSN